MQYSFYRLLVALTCAAGFTVSANAADTPRKIADVEGVTEYRLANGLRVLTVPGRGEDTVTVHITYLVGSRHEGYGEKGMAHLLEHLLFKGTDRHPHLKDELTRRGARWNGTTSYDRTTYFETLPADPDNLDWALRMEADRMLHARITRGNLDGEMTVVRNEFEIGENNPGSVLVQRMQGLAFAWHNYGNPVIGTRSDIESVPIERLQSFYRTWYRPDNAVLILGGRFDERRALQQVAKIFGSLRGATRAMPKLYTVEPTQDGERSVTLRRSGDTPLVATLYRLPSGAHPDYPALDVLVSLLGAVPTGRLHRALVQPGIATSTWAVDRALHDPGYAFFGASLSREESVAAARDALLKAIEGLATDPVRSEEVERARTVLLNEFDRMSLETGSFVRALAEFSALGDWRLFFLYRDRIRKVSVGEVQRAGEMYLRPANRVSGTFLPTTQAERAEIPPTPELAPRVSAYQGGSAIATGEQFDARPEAIEARVLRRTLANGIRIALLPKKTAGGLVFAQLALHWGDEATRFNRNTACSLASGMLARGTRRHTRAELRDALDRINSTISVSLDGASIESRQAHFGEALRWVAESLREPAFPEAEFEELKRATLTSSEGRRADPAAVAGIELSRHLTPYPSGHPRQTQSIDEQVKSIGNVTLDDARSCYRELAGATGGEFSAVGDFVAEEVAREVEALFGDWRPQHPYARIPERHFQRAATRRVVRTPDKANAVLRGGLGFPMRDDDPDYPALLVGSYLIGGSPTGRLPARIREKEGLSYSTYSWVQASPHEPVASFGVSANFAPGNIAKIERALREEFERAIRDGFSEQEVAAGKAGLLKARQVARADDRYLASRLASHLHLGRSFAWDIRLEQRIAALTPADIRSAMGKHLDPSALSMVIAGSLDP